MINKPSDTMAWRYVGAIEIAVEMERTGPCITLRVHTRIGGDRTLLMEAILQDYERAHFHHITRPSP